MVHFQNVIYAIWGPKVQTKSKSPYIFSLCQTNLENLIDSSYLSARGYLPLIWKYSVSHTHVASVYLEERLPLAKELSLENLRILIYVSTGFTLFFIVLLLFFYQSPSSSLYMVFDPSSSNIDEVHSINPFASVFVLELSTIRINLFQWYEKTLLQ